MMIPDLMGVERLKKAIRRTAAGFMAVWLSGIVFVVCCVAMNGSAMDGESCPLAQMTEHCDKTESANSPSLIVRLTETESLECCGVMPLVFDKARKLDRSVSDGSIVRDETPLRFSAPLAGVRQWTIGFRYIHIHAEQKLFITHRALRI